MDEFHTFFYVKVYPALEVDSVLLSSVMEKSVSTADTCPASILALLSWHGEVCAVDASGAFSARDGSCPWWERSRWYCHFRLHRFVRTHLCVLDYAQFPICSVDGFSAPAKVWPLVSGSHLFRAFLAVRQKSTCFRILWEMTSGLVSVFSAFSWYDSGYKFASVHGALWTDFTRFST